MFVVKLKYKNDNKIHYSNENFIHEKQEALENKYLSIKNFSMKLDTAKKLYHTLLMKYIHSNNVSVSWDIEKYVQYIALVELSNYEPYTEYQVLDYREFK